MGEFFGTFLSYMRMEKVGGILKSGSGRWCTFSMGNYFPHDIIIFPTCIFCSMKFTCNRCVWSTVVIFPKKAFLWKCFCFLLRLMGNAGSP